NASGFLPARTNSTMRRRNSGGYGGWDFGIMDTSFSNDSVSTKAGQLHSPCIDQTGAIIIPFNADPKYHYWNGGQSLADTLMELNAPENVWRNHTEKPYSVNAT
ncbi:MAG: hypothetical protein V1766_10995, partial [Pseudomonadota bacterium]